MENEQARYLSNGEASVNVYPQYEEFTGEQPRIEHFLRNSNMMIDTEGNPYLSTGSPTFPEYECICLDIRCHTSKGSDPLVTHEAKSVLFVREVGVFPSRQFRQVVDVLPMRNNLYTDKKHMIKLGLTLDDAISSFNFKKVEAAHNALEQKRKEYVPTKDDDNY